jgi:hypothetical protein
MKSVWSMWTKPFKMKKSSTWMSDFHHLLSWILSVETARIHYPETILYTDDDGARLLVDGLGLDFDQVFTDLNVLCNYDPEWWAIGKIYTYLQQQEPFLHIDSDVFLWKPLPERMENAPVFAQNPEYIEFHYSWYYLQKFDLVKKFKGWVPEEVEWYKSSPFTQRALCCGIFGGNRTDFIRYYAEQAINTLIEPINQMIWLILGGDNILVEQYLLSACVEYHSTQNSSPFHDIRVECLFDSSGDAFNPTITKDVGYTHLIGGAKRSEHSCKLLEKRVKKDFPKHYERCVNYAMNGMFH